jgi:hypothetical protein
VEATGWLKMRAGVRKCADAGTVTGGIDLVRGAGNRGGLGKAIPLNPSPFLIRLKRSLDTAGQHIATFRMRGVGRYTKKPYTLEKMGIAVKEELEK